MSVVGGKIREHGPPCLECGEWSVWVSDDVGWASACGCERPFEPVDFHNILDKMTDHLKKVPPLHPMGRSIVTPFLKRVKS